MNPIHQQHEVVSQPDAGTIPGIVPCDNGKFDVETNESIVGTPTVSTEGPPPLSTACNLWIFGFYFIFIAIGNVAAYGIGVLVYIRLYSLSLVWAFNAALIAFTFQTITQVVVGCYCDKIVTSYGRRKPFVIAGNACKAVSLFLLVLPPSQEQDVLIGWFCAFLSLFFVGDALGSNPFDSWMVESTASDEDYTRIMSLSSPIGGLLGQLLGAGLLYTSPVACGVVFLAGIALGTWMMVVYIPNVVYRAAPPLPDLIPSVRICTQTVEFRKMLVNKVLIGAAIAIFSNIAFFYLMIGFRNVNDVNGAANWFIIVAGIAAFAGVILMVACNWLFKVWDKLDVYLFQAWAVMLLSLVCFFVSLDGGDDALYLYIAIAAGMASLAFPIRLMDTLFVRDLVIYDTFITGLNRENMYITAFTIPSNIIQQFVAALPVITLTFFGFVTVSNASTNDDSISTHYEWTDDSVWVCRIYGSFVIFMIAFGSYWVLRDYGLTAAVADEINAVINKRNGVRDHRMSLAGGGLAAGENRFGLSPQQMDLTAADNDAGAGANTGAGGVAISDHEHQLLLHLSITELYHVHSAPADSSSQLALALLSQLNVAGGVMATLTSLCLLAALVVDLGSRNLYSTALIAVILMVAFYILYEYLRGLALREMCSWEGDRLRLCAGVVFEEFARGQETLHEMLDQARSGATGSGGSGATGGVGTETEAESTKTAGGQMVIRRPSLSASEDILVDIDRTAYAQLFGVKRIFATFAVLLGCGIAIILTEI